MCYVRFSFNVPLTAEPERYLIEVNTEVYDYNDSDEEVVIGKGRCFFADLEGAVDDLGDGPDYILDMEGATADYIEPLFVPGLPELRQDVVELLDEVPIGINILILDRIEILPRFRHKGLSGKINREMIRHFSAKTSLVALKAFPLQFEAKSPDNCPSEWEAAMKLEELPADQATATQKLMDLYSDLGFKDTGIGGVMVRIPESQ